MDSKYRVVSPEVIQAAQTWEVDLGTVRGTGPDGRITEADVIAARRAYLEGLPINAETITKVAASAAQTPGARQISASALETAKGLAMTFGDLTKVTGTGEGGEITAGDLRASFGLRREPFKSEQERASYYGMTVAQLRKILERPTPSPIAAASGSGYVGGLRVDPNLNPLVAEVTASQPQRVAASVAKGLPEPTLFASGDLPPFTASGIDPDVLRQVPWPARHAMAQADQATAYRMLNEYAGTDGAEAAAALHEADPGNVAYRDRVAQWISAGLSEADIEAAFNASPIMQGILARGFPGGVSS